MKKFSCLVLLIIGLLVPAVMADQAEAVSVDVDNIFASAFDVLDTGYQEDVMFRMCCRGGGDDDDDDGGGVE